MDEPLSERVLADATEIAAAFHKVYEQRAPLYNYKTRPESAVPWSKVPHENKALMITTVAEAVLPFIERAVVADRLARAEIHDDGPQGMTYVWLCSFCGQPLTGPDDVCNSAAHVRPDGSNVGTAIRSIDLATVAERLALTEQIKALAEEARWELASDDADASDKADKALVRLLVLLPGLAPTSEQQP